MADAAAGGHDASADVTAVEKDERRYSAAEVANIVRDRIARQAKAHQGQLATIAEQAARAAVARLQASHEAELAETLELLGARPQDLVSARRARRAMEGTTRGNRGLRHIVK